MLLAIAFLVPLGIWTYMINHVQTDRYQEQVQAEIQNITGQYAGLPETEVSLVEIPQPFGLIRQLDFGDEMSAKLRRSYISQGYRIVGSHISPFNCLPTSTLNTYLDQNIYILFKPRNGKSPSAIGPEVKPDTAPAPP